MIITASSGIFAQTISTSPNQLPIPKTPGVSAKAKVTTPVVKTTTHTMVKTTPVKAVVVIPRAVKTTVVLKKDGSPDKRYNSSRAMKKDGSPDMRYKKNKKS